jgi:lipoic acid synthetase
MVDRDDLLDGGASHVARTVEALHERKPELMVETLVGDFAGRHRDVETVVESGPHVFAHNVEVPRRLTPSIRDPRCAYDRSLDVLRHAKALSPERLTKSSIMVGVGETPAEVLETLQDLRRASVDVVTIGQYLRPSPKHAPVDRYVEPEEFARYEQTGRDLGFAYVASGPLVRSSYHAAEAFLAARLGEREGEGSAGSPRVARPSPDAPQNLGAPLISAASLVRKTRV